jgi:hypothetical protein
VSESKIIKLAQEFRAKNPYTQAESDIPLEVGQIRILKHRQHFKDMFLYALILQVNMKLGIVKVALLDTTPSNATPFDIILKGDATGAPFELLFIPSVSGWVEYEQVANSGNRGHVDKIAAAKAIDISKYQDSDFSKQEFPLGWELGILHIQLGDHAWLDRSYLIEKFFENSLRVAEMENRASETSTSLFYFKHLDTISSYSELFNNFPSTLLEENEEAMNIDQARLIDFQIRGDKELVIL